MDKDMLECNATASCTMNLVDNNETSEIKFETNNNINNNGNAVSGSGPCQSNGVGPSSSSSSPLDIQLVCDSFLQSIADKNEIDIFLYLQAFSELIKFFNMFGTLFTFVTKDVQSKITLLQTYANEKNDGFNYQTIQTMIDYEKGQNLLTDQKRPSGSRTLLRLHRALEFISTFLHEITKLEDDASTVSAARSAYNQTLSKYHPWVVRKSVQIAIYALPYRKNLIERVYGGVYPFDGQPKMVNENISNLANIIDQVFIATQKLYEKHDLLDLP